MFLNPPELHDPTPFGYSHTVRVPAGSAWVSVAGQYGSDHEGAAVSADFATQVRRAFHNVALALAAHALQPRHVVQLWTYVVAPDFEKLGIIASVVAELWGDQPPVHTLIGVASLAMPDIAFEVDALAVCP